jgi:O-antigen/teichoic acid export membrane protein
MRLFFGEEFVPAAPALPVLGGAFVFICYGYLTGNMLLILGIQKRQIVDGLAGLVVNVVGNLILVPRYGFLGAAWMTLVTEVVVVGTGGYYVVRQLGGLSVVSVGRLPRVAAAAAVLTAALVALKVAGAGLAVLSLAAAILYPSLLIGFGAVSVEEIRLLLVRRGTAAVPGPNGAAPHNDQPLQ